MAEQYNNRITTNKHYTKASDIDINVFSSDEILRRGEIIISNDADNPGLYIIDSEDKVINIAAVSGQSIDIEALRKELKKYVDEEIAKKAGTAGQIFLTESEYAAWAASGMLSSTCLYYVYEDEEKGGGGVIITGNTMVISGSVVNNTLMTTNTYVSDDHKLVFTGGGIQSGSTVQGGTLIFTNGTISDKTLRTNNTVENNTLKL